MDYRELKKILNNDSNLIVKLLESMDCHHIKIIEDKRIVCALPDGDNPESIQVLLGEDLNVKIWTRNEFENQKDKDIYGLVEYLKKVDLVNASRYICKTLNIDFKGEIKQKNKSNSLAFLKKYKKNLNKNEELSSENETVLSSDIKKRFCQYPHELFLKEGISFSSQEKFEVGYDLLEDRVIFPIKNEKGNIVSYKGRICNDEYREMGIPKYLYYYDLEAKYYLYGLYENYFDILMSKEVIVFEAEKSVQQLDTIGLNIGVATCKKIISQQQVRKLIKLKTDITIAFDKDVSLKEIFIECRKFKGLCNVYYIYDFDNLLSDKMSPTDKGKDIFMKLYNNYKFKYKGE